MKYLFSFMKLFLVCFVCFSSSFAFANWYAGSGSVALTNDQTLSQCKAAALQAAKTNIFSKAGLEKFSSKQMEICSDTVEATHCELHQQTLNYYEGAYIAGTRNVQVGNSAKECTASLEAEVKVYGSQHDPSFGLEAPLALAKNEQAVQELFTPAKTIKIHEASSASDLLKSGQYEAAIEAAKLELQSGKNAYQNLLIIGDAHRHSNRFDDAVESYLSAIANDKNQSIGYEKLSLGYLNLKRIDLAKASLSKAISPNPESSAIRYKLAIINESQNANNKAAKLYFQAGELAIREKSNDGIYSSLTALERLSDTEYGQTLYNSLLSRAEAYQQQELNTDA